MSKTNQTRRGGEVNTAAVRETLRIYHAWLGYLLSLQGKSELRVRVEDIRTALNRFSCTVTREGDEYVVLVRTREAAHGG